MLRNLAYLALEICSGSTVHITLGFVINRARHQAKLGHSRGSRLLLLVEGQASCVSPTEIQHRVGGSSLYRKEGRWMTLSPP